MDNIIIELNTGSNRRPSPRDTSQTGSRCAEARSPRRHSMADAVVTAPLHRDLVSRGCEPIHRLL